jgi:hypothetical protein
MTDQVLQPHSGLLGILRWERRHGSNLLLREETGLHIVKVTTGEEVDDVEELIESVPVAGGFVVERRDAPQHEHRAYGLELAEGVLGPILSHHLLNLHLPQNISVSFSQLDHHVFDQHGGIGTGSLVRTLQD